MILPNLKARSIKVLHVVKVGTTLINVPTGGRILELTQGRINQHGRILAKNSSREARVDLLTIHPDQPRAGSPINDNYCVKVLRTGLLAGSEQPTPDKTLNIFPTRDFCKLYCCKSCMYCTRACTKERYKSQHVRLLSELQIKICEIKICENMFSVSINCLF